MAILNLYSMGHILNWLDNSHTAVIIVTYGRSKLTKNTLDTLLNSRYNPAYVTVTVIDNGSHPELVSILTQYHTQIDNLVLLNDNRGKPYAWNLGVQIVQQECRATNKPTPQYLLFCDNDISFKPGWHEKLVNTFREYKDLPLCAISGYTWPHHKIEEIKRGQTQINIQTKAFPPGCCVFMSKESYIKNGPWDTRRLIRSVDTSYFRNAKRRGWKVGSIWPESVIEHADIGHKQRTWNISNGKPKLLS